MNSQRSLESGACRWSAAWPLNSRQSSITALCSSGLSFSLCSSFPIERLFFRKLLNFLYKLDSVDTIQQGQWGSNVLVGSHI